MARKHYLGLCLVTVGLMLTAAVACSSPAANSPTAAPKQGTQTTKASDAAQPSTNAAQPSKPAASASGPQKPADYPKRAISLIVPFAAGGSTDIGFRLLGAAMEKVMGSPVEIVNKAGAGSQVGNTELANAKPDGYTIGSVAAPGTITIYLDPERKAAFTWDSFAPIGLHVWDPNVVIVPADSKYKTLKDLLDDAKQHPSAVKIANTGILGDDDLAILKLQKATNVKFAIVNFDSGAPALTALLGGHIDAAVQNVGDILTSFKGGKVRLLAVLDNQRCKFIPDVPTAEEQGVKVYNNSSRALVAPKGTPKEIVTYLAQVMEQAMKDPEQVKKLDDGGFTLRYLNPEQLDKYWRQQEEETRPLMSLAKDR